MDNHVRHDTTYHGLSRGIWVLFLFHETSTSSCIQTDGRTDRQPKQIPSVPRVETKFAAKVEGCSLVVRQQQLKTLRVIRRH